MLETNCTKKKQVGISFMHLKKKITLLYKNSFVAKHHILHSITAIILHLYEVLKSLKACIKIPDTSLVSIYNYRLIILPLKSI